MFVVKTQYFYTTVAYSDRKMARGNEYYLTLEEVKRIINAANNLRDRLVIKLLARTGIRRSELCAIRIQDVDHERKLIYIPHGKGGKPRSVPIDEDTLMDMKFYLGARHHGKLVQSNNTKTDGIDLSGINEIVRKTAEKAGVKHPDPARKHMNPHVFRHSFVRHLISLGMPPNYVQRLVGHADIRTTLQIYGIPSFLDAQKKYDEMIKQMI